MFMLLMPIMAKKFGIILITTALKVMVK